MLGAGKIGCVVAADQTNYLDFHLWGLTQRTVLMAPPSIRRKNSLNSREVPHSASIPITSLRLWKNLRHLKKLFCRRLRIDACFNFKSREIQPTCWSAWFNKIQTVLGCRAVFPNRWVATPKWVAEEFCGVANSSLNSLLKSRIFELGISTFCYIRYTETRTDLCEVHIISIIIPIGFLLYSLNQPDCRIRVLRGAGCGYPHLRGRCGNPYCYASGAGAGLEILCVGNWMWSQSTWT